MNKLFKYLAALFAASSISFAVGISGFVDASYDDDTAAIDFDEIELRLSLDAEGSVSGNADISIDAAGDLSLEQAYLTYGLTNGASLTVGSFESTLGFDAYDADGLIANGAGLDLGLGYDEGIRYTSGNVNVTLAEAGGVLDGDAQVIEASYSASLGEGLNGFIGFRTTDDGVTSTDITNAYVTYETGALTLIGEVFDGEGQVEGNQIAAVYGYSDASSITLRSASQTAANGVETDTTTIAHATSLSDDLALIVDISDNDETTTVVELLYTF